MKIGKVKKQLKKINTLFSTIEEEGEISSIEKELLRSYIIDLYEKVNELASIGQEPKTPVPFPPKIRVRSSSDKESIFNDPTPTPVKSDTLEKVVEREQHTWKNNNLLKEYFFFGVNFIAKK